MAVTEQWSGSEFSQSGEWSATRRLVVTGEADIKAALAATGVPALNDAHPLSTRLSVASKTASPVGFGVWEVTVTYAEGDQDEGGSGGSDDPLDEPPLIQWDPGVRSDRIDRDIDGNAILNSARDAPSEPPQKEVGTLALVITRNEPFFDIRKSLVYRNTVNSAAWNPRGVGTLFAGQAYCQTIRPTHAYQPNPDFVTVEYRFLLEPDGHQLLFLDQGRRAQRSGGIVGNITSQGAPLEIDVLLNGYGTPVDTTLRVDGYQPVNFASVPTGATLVTVPAGGAFMLRYDRYREVDFNLLRL